jgi:hypothetical protein
MRHRAVWVPNDPLDLVRLDGDVEVVGNPQLKRIWEKELSGVYVPPLMWKLAGRPSGAPCQSIRDDNRSALLTDKRHVIHNTEYIACIKGCGAEFDAYQHSRLTPAVLKEVCHDALLASELAKSQDGFSGFVTGERWFGNTPYGAQAPDNAMIALLASLRANGNEISGFHVCPVVALVRLPDVFANMASKFFWYRKYEGTYWQEIRLMPSNVRLYFQSPVTFGANTAEVFSLFNLSSFEACERFIERLARSTIAALTLYARTLRFDSERGRYLGLGYHDVWLDKDAVIAPDGTLHFADLEGIEDIAAKDTEEVKEQIGVQFHRNVYEASYALEAMAAQTERSFSLGSSKWDRRRWLMDVLDRACRSDSYVRLERDGNRMIAVVEPSIDDDILETEIELFSEVDPV